MLSDGLANLGAIAPAAQPELAGGPWICSVIVVAAWGSILLMGVTDPLGGINTLFPAVRHRQPAARGDRADRRHRRGDQEGPAEMGLDSRHSAVVGSDRHADRVVAEDLLGDPKLGYWTQHFQYRNAQEAGKTAFGSAKNADQLSAVIRNTFIQGTLSIVFALVVIVVVGAAIVVALRAIRGTGRPPAEEDAGAVANLRPVRPDRHPAEKEVQKLWDALPPSPANPLVHRHIDGRYALPPLRRAPRPDPSRRTGAQRTDYWKMRHRHTEGRSGRALLLADPVTLLPHVRCARWGFVASCERARVRAQALIVDPALLVARGGTGAERLDLALGGGGIDQQSGSGSMPPCAERVAGWAIAR